MPIWGVWMNGAFGFTTGEGSARRATWDLPYCVVGVTIGDERDLEGVVWLDDDVEVRRAFAALYGEIQMEYGEL
jgi:hypothetical protein